QAEDGIRDFHVTGVQTCALPIFPLRAENGFLPDLDAVPEEVARKAKLLFLNFPNNPTGAVATVAFYQKAVDFARKHDILIVSDKIGRASCRERGEVTGGGRTRAK